jgi:hypothetical protein
MKQTYCYHLPAPSCATSGTNWSSIDCVATTGFCLIVVDALLLLELALFDDEALRVAGVA